MNKIEKIILIILFGSIWGAAELFGGDLFRAWQIPNKSSLLFAIALIIMYSSKSLVNINGSTVIMALIAGAFKTVSDNFYGCQVAAITIDAVIFEFFYFALKTKLYRNFLTRLITAPLLTYIAFAFFAFFATYILRQENWYAGGLTGIGEYLISGALYAAVYSLAAIQIGFYLGAAFKPLREKLTNQSAVFSFRLTAAAIALLIWIVGLQS
ncbi:MAG: hypothetical protein GX409_10500 [candidate division Zixibacteria bacterium]|nr:hypothetical protein [candidate division Zixibacteria bacterium]